MRISTQMIYDSGTRNLQRQQSEMYRLQNQMSTGRRILTPSDDPVAAAQALVVTQQKNINQQFLDNQGNAASLLAEQEDRLNSVVDLIQAVRGRIVEAGNGAYSDNDRKAIAAEIRERYEELLGLANSSDAMGNYVFAGTKGATQPFLVSGDPGARQVSYAGNETRRQLQVSTGRIMDVSASGSDVFQKIPLGNGVFTATASAANTGTGVISSSRHGTYDGVTYQLDFTSATSYTISYTPVGGSATTSTGTYVDGESILLPPGATAANAQLSVAITGTPVAGDRFTVAPAANQDIFATLDQMISALEGSVAGSPANRAAYQNKMNAVAEHVDQALEHLLGLQTGIGARRLELDALTSFGGDLDLQYQTDLSNLQDLDYTAAITSMAQRQMAFEAAQATFSKVSQLSLFQYL